MDGKPWGSTSGVAGRGRSTRNDTPSPPSALLSSLTKVVRRSEERRAEEERTGTEGQSRRGPHHTRGGRRIHHGPVSGSSPCRQGGHPRGLDPSVGCVKGLVRVTLGNQDHHRETNTLVLEHG